MARKDLTNQRFGRLIALRYAETRGSYAFWECLCDCGKTVVIKGSNLIRKHTQSCGCLQVDRAIEATKKRVKEGRVLKETLIEIDGKMHKHCNKCDKTLPIEEFMILENGSHLYECTNCETKRINEWREKNPDKSERIIHKYKTSEKGRISVRNSTLRKYKLKEVEFRKIKENQNNVCKICKGTNKDRELHVDHDHKTGRIRALLCHKCNITLGCVSDDIVLLSNAIKYLITYNNSDLVSFYINNSSLN